MTDFRAVTESFSVSPQITAADVAAAATQGFTLIINNRPDGEAAGQPSGAEIGAAAAEAGLAYAYIPVTGRPTAEQAMAVRDAVGGAGGKVLAFCRSGTRSILAWTMAEAADGRRSNDELVRLGAGAGYDVSGALRG